MHNSLSLSTYVKRRNGVALGAPGSMSNMLKRSLGASSFYQFWRYWNPIWGYYLAGYVMKPLCRIMPMSLAVILTFVVSGALHDLAIMIVKWRLTFLFTPWFFLMSLVVLVTKHFAISYQQFHWLIRALINLGLIACCLMLALVAERQLIN